MALVEFESHNARAAKRDGTAGTAPMAKPKPANLRRL
jgi:hypothetical protein